MIHVRSKCGQFDKTLEKNHVFYYENKDMFMGFPEPMNIPLEGGELSLEEPLELKRMYFQDQEYSLKNIEGNQYYEIGKPINIDLNGHGGER